MENEFQYRLLKVLNERGMTASELSRLSGIGKSDLSNYLNGKYLPKQDKVYLIAKALNVDPGWLITGVEPTKLPIQTPTLFEQALIGAYRAADEWTKSAVKKLLDMQEKKTELGGEAK